MVLTRFYFLNTLNENVFFYFYKVDITSPSYSYYSRGVCYSAIDSFLKPKGKLCSMKNKYYLNCPINY